MNSSRGKILVIRGGAIGDFILTLPAIAALRRQFPDAHLEVLGYPHIVQLAVAGELVDRVQSIEARALAGFFARNGALEPDLADYFSEFDIIVSYLFDPDEIFKKNIARCSPAQFIVGPHRPNENEPLHAAKVFLKPLERLAIFEADSIPRISFQGQPRIAPKPVESGSTFNLVALHPGSGSEKKNWAESNWVNLLQFLLSETNAGILLIGGEAEGERLQRLAAALPPQRIKVAQSLPLAELARLLQTCTAFVGHDSGISHLAAAVGLPGVILWGETAEAIWRPPHERVRIIKSSAGLRGLTVAEVSREISGLLNR
ncbi:MAG TPA: glycosyltransferase family 9 protein [Verrucomicrobiae bacterium]|nr:glycosyltransferase family 9 protein [Verrucomicrobiae bacterium]